MTGAAAAGGGAAVAAPGAGGVNPFWEVSNLFAQKNRQGAVASYQLGASTLDGGGELNPGNFLRGPRLLVRTITPGVAGTAQADGPFNFFKQLGLENVDGAEILYNVIGGYAYAQRHRFGRPWLQDPTLAYDYSYNGNTISFTLPLFTEVRQQLGVLENTDTRSQYNWTQTINTETAVQGSGATTAATVSVTPYVDMWAQPDSEDLEKVPNQQIPPGTNLQTKTRHQTFTLNGAGSDNNFLSTLTGNAVRWALLIVRDSNNARQDYLSDPITWQLDQRNLGTFAPDIAYQWAEDFYRAYGGVARPTGVYPFPRFYSPGTLYGQGWLYTANSTALYWESSTLSTAVNVPGTVELLQEEVYAVGPVDPSLIDL
jgi:hypothetical protein